MSGDVTEVPLDGRERGASSVERFTGRYVARAPISHGADTSTGVVQRLRTLQVNVTDPETGETYVEDVPVVSGNSLRGQLRDLLATDFLERISDGDSAVELSDALFNTFYSGGTPQAEGGPGRIKRLLVEDIREHVPPLSLFGGAVGSQIFSGRLNVGQLWPICMETRAMTGIDSDRPVYSAFVDSTFYTRRDDRDGGRAAGEDVQQMRFRVHCFTPGTEFHHELSLEGATDVERSCLGHALDLFVREPVIGGMHARGHGDVTVEYEDGEGLPDGQPYRDYVADARTEIREFVEDLDERVA